MMNQSKRRINGLNLWALLLAGAFLLSAAGAMAQDDTEVVVEEAAPVPEMAAPETAQPPVPQEPAAVETPDPGMAPPPPPPAPVRNMPAAPPRAGTPGPRSSRPMPMVPSRGNLPSRRAQAGAPAPSLPPQAPDEPVVPNDEKTGEKAEEPVSFDFHDAPLYDVVESISRLTGRNFDVDPTIAQSTVTLITHDRIPPEMAYEVLESVLTSRGFSMVESLDGHLIKILPTPEVGTSGKVPLITGDARPPEGFDGFSTHILTLKNADGAEMLPALQTLGTKNGKIDVYAPTNTLIITDTADGIKRMFAFLDQADIPGLDTSMEIFTLEYTRAEMLMNQINQVLLEDGAQGGAPMRPGQPIAPTPVRPSTRPTTRTPSAPGSQVIGARLETLRMVPDERLNSLIVVATEGMMVKVRDLVKRLDTPTPYEANNMHIYQLLNADAEMVEQALQPLVGTAPRKQSTGGGAGGGAPGGAPMPSGGGGGAAPEVQPFEQKVQITRYDQTNSLLIVAAPQDYKLLEAFIARLDVPQRQVSIDAVVMDVTISNEFGLTVDSASVTGRDGFGLTNTSNLSELAKAAQAAQEIVGGRRAALATALLGLGNEGGLTTGVFDDITISVDGKPVKVPFVPLLLQAIEKLSDVEVLSQPSLTTLDNEEASIVVGQEVPFITSTSSSRTGTGQVDTNNYYGGYTRVERQEVGVKLKVTPQISEGDNVLIQTEVEISDTDAKQIGTVDIVGPTTNKSVVTNKALVKDGSTAVIAGLIRDNAFRSTTQPPVLGDIPLVGWMFGSKSTKREKRNMVVLLTPHIIKEGMDLDRLTTKKVNDYYDSNVEELFKTGFFKKIKKKYDMQTNYRPSLKHTESLTGRRTDNNFRRGDVDR